ncbi:protein translocase subunit SecDF [Albibacterium bauzanense]|uniref:Multifunctional fusion protein n=1 Tax=Albibacterium bauzanense TaxID=653929 RepID=A0A4R1LZQ9_9SPHI|nr:protein translocase subunit SecDF [Albibacterium bauzanense]TCK84825.1 SecD/SecF fusion protein [Albibacterium bauzanense]
MQGKGIIQFFIGVVTLACVYSISFTFVARSVEKDAAAYANGDMQKERAYLDSVADLTAFNLGFAKYTYQEAKEREIALGLDLKGGMNVTMEISLQELIRNLAGNPKDTNFDEALRNAEIRTKESQTDFVTLFGEEFKKLSPNVSFASFFATKDNVATINAQSSDAEVLDFLRAEANSAIDRSFNILRTRIDKFGVSAPNIQKQQGTNRILIELPGVTDEQRVRNLLQGSAKLEFWETYDNTEIFSLLENINATLASALKNQKATTTNAVADTTAVSTEQSQLAALTGGSTDSLSNDSAAVTQDAQNNPFFNVVQPSVGLDEGGQTVLRPGPVIGYVAQKDTALVNSYLQNPSVKSIIPSNVKLAWSVKVISKEDKRLELYALKPSTSDGQAALGGSVIADARADFDQQGNPQVFMMMNTEGARDWRRITAAASADPNNKKAIAIVLDNVVYSAPTVQDEIPSGNSSISGNFQIQDTQDLANVLKAGRLPAPAKIVEEAIIGPTLGQAAIDAGINSSVIGLIVVLVFMICYYNKAGIVANIAVLFNVFFIMGILASLGAVLTLPGIAGIVLTMGTAVDANVLIYERIREELRLGKSIRQALADGYKHAMPSILDSQITTFLVGLILFIFGSGPIAGFATTLMIGIISSLFTSIFISRIIFEWMLEKDWKISVSYPWSSHTFLGANYKFYKNRKISYTISTIAIVISLIFIFTKGFNLGVDFKGGRTYVADFENSVNLEEVRDYLNTSFGQETEVKTYGGNDKLRITTSYLVDETNDTADDEVLAKLNEGLSQVQNNPHEIVSSQKVGPTIANDIKTSAVYSMIFAIIGIGIYVLIRFRKWQYSLASAASLLHDAIILLGIFSIFDGILPFSLDMDQNFIAAILTVLGYSINDTVVVFDRMREYLNIPSNRKKDHGEIINEAINSTLSRTIITSLTVIFVIGVLFIFGGEVIRSFSFAILIGLFIGTYSSIFTAAPIVGDLTKDEEDEVKVVAEKAKVVKA